VAGTTPNKDTTITKNNTTRVSNCTLFDFSNPKFDIHLKNKKYYKCKDNNKLNEAMKIGVLLHTQRL
jgi:hypothetical protein